VLAHLSFPPRYLVVAEGPQHGLKLHSIVDRAPLSLPDANGDGDTVLACLGDSNTAVNPSTTTKWCELLQALVDEPRFRIVNFARGGATAIRSREPSGYDQLPQAIAAGADAIVLAFGTNDTNRENKADPDAVLRAYRELSAAAEREGIEVFVATTPPRYDLDDAPIRALNQRLRDELPADRLIDFDSIVDAEDFAGGGLHLLRSGQLKRARSAYRALTAGNRRP
jgi:lysophospholipase L1-like esterase